MNPEAPSGSLPSVEAIARDPARLAALCGLLQEGGGDAWITLEGRSMLPAIMPGSRLRLRCQGGQARVGDIVAYAAGDHLVVHRLLRIVEDPSGARQFILGGDNNSFLDPPVTLDSIVGTVVEVRPPGAAQRLCRLALAALIRVKKTVRPLLPRRSAPARRRVGEEEERS